MDTPPPPPVPTLLPPNDSEDTAVTPLSRDVVLVLIDSFYELFPDSPPRGPRDIAYFWSLVGDFGPELDIAEEMKRFAAWSLDRAAGVVKYPRSSLRDWLRRARIYQRHAPRRDR